MMDGKINGNENGISAILEKKDYRAVVVDSSLYPNVGDFYDIQNGFVVKIRYGSGLSADGREATLRVTENLDSTTVNATAYNTRDARLAVEDFMRKTCARRITARGA